MWFKLLLVTLASLIGVLLESLQLHFPSHFLPMLLGSQSWLMLELAELMSFGLLIVQLVNQWIEVQSVSLSLSPLPLTPFVFLSASPFLCVAQINISLKKIELFPVEKRSKALTSQLLSVLISFTVHFLFSAIGFVLFHLFFSQLSLPHVKHSLWKLSTTN